MKLNDKIDISQGIVTASVWCEELSENTAEALDDFPKYVKYGDINFEAAVKVLDGTQKPEICDNDDPDGEKVVINLVDKSILLDENFRVELKIDSAKISEKELTTTLVSTELLSKAKALVFIKCIKDKVTELVEIARANNDPDIEEETETVI